MMKKSLVLFLTIGNFLFLYLSCQTPTEPEKKITDKTVTLNGQVLNKQTNNPIDSAVVRILNISPEIVEMTDSEGKFNIEFTAENTINISVTAFKESYLPDTTIVLAVPGRTITVPPLTLEPTAQTPTTSGEAASIILFSQSSQSIGVQESGSIETAELVFEVQDSSGHPVDLEHSVEVKFSIGSGPGAEEFIHPTTAKTANNGQVTVSLFSGTKAGVVQIIAEANVGANLIRSQPVAIAIHGGLPDSLHFSLAPEKVNFAGYVTFGLTDIITAFVGDKYANPVKPGTAVYFTTTGGIIEGSSLTDEQGQASVSLISAEPMPIHPTLGPGFATITGKTADENQNTISAETIVLFSGHPVISINPNLINIPNAGSQTFSYTVCDHNGNPLAEGNGITVTIDGESASANGALNKTIPDTQNKMWTNFSFTVFDAAPDTIYANPVSITISTSGPNGYAEIGISGVSY